MVWQCIIEIVDMQMSGMHGKIFSKKGDKDSMAGNVFLKEQSFISMQQHRKC